MLVLRTLQHLWTSTKAPWFAEIFCKFREKPHCVGWEQSLSNHQTDDDFVERLVVSVSTSLQNYLAPNNPNHAAAVVLPHQRLLLRRVDTIPMVTRLAPYIGPSATLPNGNIVTVCSEPDNLIRILDVQPMEILSHPWSLACAASHPRCTYPTVDGPIDWVTDHLFYSNGYLVLHRTALLALIPNGSMSGHWNKTNPS